MFENVNFAFYSGAFGRTAIPDEETFNQYALKNRQFVKTLVDDGLIVEREDGGIDKAVCMMIEEDFIAGGDDCQITAESVGSYSWSGTQKSLEAKKYAWLKAFCFIATGRR